MRIPVIAGNWKMNKNIGEAVELVKILRDNLQSIKTTEIEIVVAPPYTAINKVAEFLNNFNIGVSAQDLFWEDSGAFTGAISAPMIKDAGAKYAIIGHSERRLLFNETDNTINKKIKAALKAGLIPIFCIGETLQERESGMMSSVIKKQFINGLSGLVLENINKIIIAYEPVWAIGTGKTATPEQAEEVHAIIREMAGDVVRIIYGGSVKPSNCKELLSKPNIDGVLVGGASLKAEDFIGIIKSAL